MEQEEYTREEIDWSYIEFVDNQDILDLIEKVGYYLFYSWTVSYLNVHLCLLIIFQKFSFNNLIYNLLWVCYSFDKIYTMLLVLLGPS